MNVRGAAVVGTFPKTPSGGGGEPASEPAWADSTALNQWTEITTANTLSDVALCPTDDCGYQGSSGGYNSIFTAWNGGILTTRGTFGSMIVWAGGHNTYENNELYECDLDTCNWSRITDGAWPGTPLDADNGEFSDGSPVPPHTYAAQDWDSSRDELVVFIGTPSHITGDFTKVTHHWSEGDGWSRGEHGMCGTGSCASFDSNRNVFWGLNATSGNNFVKYDPAQSLGSRVTTQIASITAPFQIDIVSAVDTVRDLLVVADFRGGTGIRTFDLTSPTTQPVTRTLSGDGAAMVAEGGGGSMRYVSTLDLLLFYRNDGQLYTIDPSDWSVTALAVAGDSPANTSSGNGNYQRLWIVEANSKVWAGITNDKAEKACVYRVA